MSISILRFKTFFPSHLRRIQNISAWLRQKCPPPKKNVFLPPVKVVWKFLYLFPSQIVQFCLPERITVLREYSVQARWFQYFTHLTIELSNSCQAPSAVSQMNSCDIMRWQRNNWTEYFFTCISAYILIIYVDSRSATVSFHMPLKGQHKMVRIYFVKDWLWLKVSGIGTKSG